MKPLNYLLYRTKADNVICYFCMTFLAFIGMAGVTVTLNPALEEADPKSRLTICREREEVKKDEEEEPETKLALRSVGFDSLKLAY